jgi:hypothetical protein
MSETYQSLSHSKWDCKYHVVFLPKQRRKAIFGQTRRQLGAIFPRAGTTEGVSDHRRLLVHFGGNLHMMTAMDDPSLVSRTITKVLVALLWAGSVYGQTAPVITSTNGQQTTNYAAFWYLGGITPGCCSDTPNGFYTQWPVYLTTNTQDPNPSIQWSTDSPARLQIVPNGTSGATLISLGHSNPGNSFDIFVFVTVDGLTSSPFPVYINTPWIQMASAPSPGACFFAGATNGWTATITETITDLTGTQLIPIDVHETWENLIPKYPGDDWPIFGEGTWYVRNWTPPPQSTFVDSIGFCWGGTPQPIPQTVAWNPNGGAQIDSVTQKFWAGSDQRFQGECTLRQAVNDYTNHFSYSNGTTPVSNQGICAQGQNANN